MSIKQKIKQLCKQNGEIEIREIDLESMCVTVLLPYESSEIAIELEGDEEDKIIESFKVGVNKRLDEMRDHLEDCKFD